MHGSELRKKKSSTRKTLKISKNHRRGHRTRAKARINITPQTYGTEEVCILNVRNLVVVVVVSHIQRIGCQPEKTTVHGGQSRSWSAEQQKKKKKSLAASPPPPSSARCLFGDIKNKKNHVTHPHV